MKMSSKEEVEKKIVERLIEAEKITQKMEIIDARAKIVKQQANQEILRLQQEFLQLQRALNETFKEIRKLVKILILGREANHPSYIDCDEGKKE